MHFPASGGFFNPPRQIGSDLSFLLTIRLLKSLGSDICHFTTHDTLRYNDAMRQMLHDA